MKKSKSVKNLKRAFYKNRVGKFKKIITWMVLVGLCASFAYFLKVAYVEYAVSRAEIVLTYPEIAGSKHPDGSRFNYYDFITDENLEEALAIMHKEGKYKDFTVEDLKNCFSMYSYLEGSAGASVSSVRSEGNDFSYVANEYKITYIQPRNYAGKDIRKILTEPDASSDFLHALVDVNRKRIAEEMGGMEGFCTLTAVENMENYDYSEALRVYKTKINAIISCLEDMEKRNPGFYSETEKLAVSDLIGKYEFLISDSLDGISNFVETSGISKDTEQTSSKLYVNIENNTLKYNKVQDKAIINQYAMVNYDQTFTENLINVVQNEEYGLYQARPKTAFDTVVTQKHAADESAAEYSAKISQFNTELAVYTGMAQTPEESARLTGKCDELMTDFEDKYETLSKVAQTVVKEYYNGVNENYITAKISHKGLLSTKLLMKMGIVFALGATLAFVLMVLGASWADGRKVNRKKKQMKDIKKLAKEA